MTFTDKAKSAWTPMRDAYRVYGRHGRLSAGIAGATALAAPWLLKNDDRGYGRTSALTTPAVAAAYAAAPSLYQGAVGFGQEFGQVWGSRPFDVSFSRLVHGGEFVRLKDYQSLYADWMGMSGDHASSILKGTLDRMAIDHYASIPRKEYNVAEARESTLSMLDALADNATSEQHELLSLAFDEATMKSASPQWLAEHPASRTDRRAAPASFSEMREAIAKQDSETFFRVFRRRAARATGERPLRMDKPEGFFATHGFPGRSTSPMALGSGNTLEHINNQRIRETIRRSLERDGAASVFANASLVYENRRIGTDPISSIPIGIEMTVGKETLHIPLIDEANRGRMVSAGSKWTEAAVANKLYSMGPDGKAVVEDIDEYVLTRVSHSNLDEMKEALETAIYSGGVTPESFQKAAFDEFKGATLSPLALKLREQEVVAAPGNSFHGKTYGSQTNEEFLATKKAMIDAGYTNIGSEHGFTSGRMQRATLAGIERGGVASHLQQSPVYRALSKPVQIAPDTIANLPRPSLLPDIFEKTLGAATVPMLEAEGYMVNPQMKTLLGDIPREAVELAQRLFGHNSDRKEFRNWVFEATEKAEGVFASEEYQKAVGNYLKHGTFGGLGKEIEAQWLNSDAYFAFDQQRTAEVMSAFGTYKNQAKDALRQMVTRDNMSHEQIESIVDTAWQDLYGFVKRNPGKLPDITQVGSLGEATFLMHPDYDPVRLEYVKNEHIDELKLDPSQYKDSPIGRDQVIGIRDGAPVTSNAKETFIREAIANKDGSTTLVLTKRYGVHGAKLDTTIGNKGMADAVASPWAWEAQRDALNVVARATGEALVPETARFFGAEHYMSQKVKNPFDAAVGNAAAMAQRVRAKEAQMQADAALSQAMSQTGLKASGSPQMQYTDLFLSELQANQIYLNASGELREDTQAVLNLGREGMLARQERLINLSNDYLNSIGHVGDFDDPILGAFQQTNEYRGSLGMSEWSFSKYLEEKAPFMTISGWDHSAINNPKKVGVTFEVLNEMQRSGMIAGVSEVISSAEFPQGDPRRTWQFARHMASGELTSKLGETLKLNNPAVQRAQLNKLDSIANTIFDPTFKPAFENFSIDLGQTWRIGEQDVRYLPVLGSKAYKGLPHRYNLDKIRSTEFQQKLNSVLDALSVGDLNPNNLNDRHVKQARAAMFEYLEFVTREMVGKKGVLRTPMVHPNAVSGTLITRAAPENPFELVISDDLIERIESSAIRDRLKSGDSVTASFFRHPVSNTFYASVRRGTSVDNMAPNTIGADERIRSVGQWDNDRDFGQLIFHDVETAYGAAAEAEAQAAMDMSKYGTAGASYQVRNLESIELLQGMTESSRHITGEMMEASAPDLLKTLQKIKDVPELSAYEKRTAGRFIGQYSNTLSEMLIRMEMSPTLGPGTTEYAHLRNLLHHTRQVTISAQKGKMTIPGGDPTAFLGRIQEAMRKGNVDLFQNAMIEVEKGAGFESIFSPRHTELFGLTPDVVEQALGTKVAYGQKFNAGHAIAASDYGRHVYARFLESGKGPTASRMIAQLSRDISNSQITAEDASKMLRQMQDAMPEMQGLVGEARGATGSAEMLRLINEAISEGLEAVRPAAKRAAPILAAGAIAAGVVGMLTTSTRLPRPEEAAAAPDHVPGEAVAGARTGSKREITPAQPGVKTTVVADMRRTRDLSVKATAPDREAASEMAKIASKAAGRDGSTNVTVNHTGGWRNRVSKLRVREQIREELDRY